MQGTQTDFPPASQRGTRKTILERLKLETAADHATIEETAGVMDPRLSLNGYRAYLASTLGFYAVVEPHLCEMGAWDALQLPAAGRLKVPLLIRDLAFLGRGEPASIRSCDVPPEWTTVANAVGGAYVLEGSTLGGRIISRHVQQRLGPEVPRAFLECYGANTGENWQAFRAALSSFAGSREVENQIVAGAQTTFRTFTRWLERTRQRA